MTTLARTLGLRDLILLIIGSVIGSGIFLVTGALRGQVEGSVGLGLLAWLGGGVLSLLGALPYGELAAMNPAAGGLYVYIRDCFGRLPAFLYGWTLFLVIASGSVATLAVAFSTYLGEVVRMPPLVAKIVSVAMIAVVTAGEALSTRQGSGPQKRRTTI